MNQDILNFIHNHLVMISIWVVLLTAIIALEFWNNRKKAPRLTAQDVIKQMNDHQLQVVDIRSTSAYRQAHIINSRNIPYLGQDEQAYASLKEEAFVLVCDQAQKASDLALKLKAQGFNKVYVLEGGLQTWQSNDLPLVKGK